MIDFHCHLDLYTNPLEVFCEAKRRKTIILAVTTSPRAYIKASKYFANSDNIYIALGFHPELVQKRVNEIEDFIKLLAKVRFIGEIGIDGSPNMRNSLTIQRDFFYAALESIEHIGNKIVSIHSRNASKEVLDALSDMSGKNAYILHWFTGTVAEAKRAIEIGCWFSINPKMCSSSKGQSLIRSLPIERIIPETDAPFTTRNNKPYMPWDMSVVEYIAKERNLSIALVQKIMKDNVERLLATGSSM